MEVDAELTEMPLEANLRKLIWKRIETSTVSSCKNFSTKDQHLKLSMKNSVMKHSSEVASGGTLQIVDLPPELIELIFRKLTFDNVGKIRTVCQYFNTIASSLLNSEFSRLRMNMLHRFQSIKAQMPRRESARRKHPLARESDIIETLHMRLTLLHMTFGKHIERKHCCFFAGEILDEVYRILHYVKTTPNLNRAYKVTDELFDLSTMAMEYFKEHVEPSLPEITYFATDFLEYTPAITSSPKTHISLLEDSVLGSSISSSKLPALESVPACHSPANQTVNKKLRRLRENIKKNNGDITAVKQELKFAKRKIASQQKQINDLKSRNEDYDRKFQNTSRKLSAILQELNRFKTEFQYWRSKSTATPCICGTITPVVEFRDPGLHIADLHSEKMSPRSQDDLTDDFIPIDFDMESLPSCSTNSNTVSSSHMTANEQVVSPLFSVINKHTEIKKSELVDEDKICLQKMCSKLGKRKLDMNQYVTKKKKRINSADVDSCSSSHTFPTVKDSISAEQSEALIATKNQIEIFDLSDNCVKNS